MPEDLRSELATATRILASHRLIGMFGHASVLTEDSGRYLVCPGAGARKDRCRSTDVLELGLDDEFEPGRPLELYMHSVEAIRALPPADGVAEVLVPGERGHRSELERLASGIPLGPKAWRSYEFLDRGFDVAFHTRHVRDCNLMLRKIADLGFSLCAAPLYLHRAGAPAQVGELSEHDCLLNTNDPIWHLGRAGHDVHLKVNDPVYSSNSYVTLRKAALAGRGIGLLPIRLVRDDLANGTLVDVLPDCEVPDRPLYALYAPGSQTLARVQLFLDFVSDWFRRQARSGKTAPVEPGARPAEEFGREGELGSKSA